MYGLVRECETPPRAFKVRQVTFLKLWSHELNNDAGKFKVGIEEFGIEIGGIESSSSEA